MFKKRNIILFLVMIIGLVSLPNQQVHAAYTNRGWVWSQATPYTGYGTVNPSGENGNTYAKDVSGAKVYLKDGTTPTTTFTYKPKDASKDPWYGGDIEVTWTGTVTLKVRSGLGGIADIAGLGLSIPNGLAFVAHVNLPEEIFSGDVQKSIKNATVKPQINIGNSTVTLNDQNFVPIGPHTLRLTMTKNNIKDITSTLIGVTTSGSDLNNLPIKFSIAVPVKDIAQNGAFDISNPANTVENSDPKYVQGYKQKLTQGRFPPIPEDLENPENLSVDFYDADKIREGGTTSKDFFGNSKIDGTTFYYANLNSDGTFLESHRSSAPVKSWDKYISPSDNTGYYNTASTSETVDGSNKGISDFAFSSDTVPIRNYNLNLDVFNGTWDQINKSTPKRFDRIVNFFTQKSTSGGTVSHSPTTGGSIGSTLPVQYTGTDSDGTALSPVQVNVGEQYQASEVKVNNITSYSDYLNNGTKPTATQSNKESQISVSWKAPSLKSGKIIYNILDASTGQGTGDKDFVKSISNTKDTVNTYQTVTGSISGLKTGTYIILFKIVDDDYPTQNDWDEANAAYITALDTPKFDVTNSVTNERTNLTDSSSIDALWGDTIDEKVKYSVTDTGQNTIINPVLTLTTPKNSTYQADSLTVKVNGTAVDLSSADYSKISSGMQVSLGNVTFKAGDSIDIAYKYKINDVSNQTISTIPATLSADAQFNGLDGKATSSAILPITSQSMNIKLPAEGLVFVQAPSSLSFGTVNRPYQAADFSTIIKDQTAKEKQNFIINNTLVGATNSNWQLSASLSQEFHTSGGQTLSSEFANITYNDGKSTSTIKNGQVTPIYSGSGKGEQTFNLDDRFKLHVDPVGLNWGLTNDTYTSQVTWNLSNGPTS